MDNTDLAAIRYRNTREDDDFRILQRLLERTINSLVYRIASPGSSDIDDYRQIARLAILTALKSWDEDRGPFKPYYHMVAKRILLTQVRRDIKLHENCTFKDEVAEDTVTHDIPSLSSELMTLLTGLISAEDLDILQYLTDGFNYRDISSKMGISLRQVDKSLQRTRACLRHHEVSIRRCME